MYIAIDLKSFYASVECVERGLDPLRAKLVVADESRTEKTICLAVSPALKELGISGRARLFEVLQKIPRDDFIIAKPRMNKYMAVSTKIFSIYASFVSPEDIHVYSIDEVFIDVSHYLKTYKMTARDLALAMIKKVLAETGITATAGIGSNLYLAKIAMDVKAKHMQADQDGVRIAELNEYSYRKELWDHQPITDFWRIGPGYARRLRKYGIETMGELAVFSLSGSEKLYKEFGVNAELLIDHAWGYEPVTMADIKGYRSDNHSISSGQVLSTPYSHDKARLIVAEMTDELVLDLVRKNLVTDQVVLTIVYDVANKNYRGELTTDRYGRKLPKSAHGSINLDGHTSSTKQICKRTLELFGRIANPDLLVRRIYVVFNHVKYATNNHKIRQLNLFVDYEKEKLDNARERRRQDAILNIKARYGKNAILRGINYEEGATMRERHKQVGGHRA